MAGTTMVARTTATTADAVRTTSNDARLEHPSRASSRRTVLKVGWMPTMRRTVSGMLVVAIALDLAYWSTWFTRRDWLASEHT